MGDCPLPLFPSSIYFQFLNFPGTGGLGDTYHLAYKDDIGRYYLGIGGEEVVKGKVVSPGNGKEAVSPLDGVKEAIATVGRRWEGDTDDLAGKDQVRIDYLGIGPEDVGGPDAETACDPGNGITGNYRIEKTAANSGWAGKGYTNYLSWIDNARIYNLGIGPEQGCHAETEALGYAIEAVPGTDGVEKSLAGPGWWRKRDTKDLSYINNIGIGYLWVGCQKGAHAYAETAG